MPVEIASGLLRKALRRSRGGPSCAACRRTPLPGELLHVLDSGRALCTLCLARLPEAKREPVRSERVRIAHSHVAPVQRAA